jgi:hypothetical protein
MQTCRAGMVRIVSTSRISVDSERRALLCNAWQRGSTALRPDQQPQAGVEQSPWALGVINQIAIG